MREEREERRFPLDSHWGQRVHTYWLFLCFLCNKFGNKPYTYLFHHSQESQNLISGLISFYYVRLLSHTSIPRHCHDQPISFRNRFQSTSRSCAPETSSCKELCAGWISLGLCDRNIHRVYSKDVRTGKRGQLTNFDYLIA